MNEGTHPTFWSEKATPKCLTWSRCKYIEHYGPDRVLEYVNAQLELNSTLGAR